MTRFKLVALALAVSGLPAFAQEAAPPAVVAPEAVATPEAVPQVEAMIAAEAAPVAAEATTAEPPVDMPNVAPDVVLEVLPQAVVSDVPVEAAEPAAPAPEAVEAAHDAMEAQAHKGQADAANEAVTETAVETVAPPVAPATPVASDDLNAAALAAMQMPVAEAEAPAAETAKVEIEKRVMIGETGQETTETKVTRTDADGNVTVDTGEAAAEAVVAGAETASGQTQVKIMVHKADDASSTVHIEASGATVTETQTPDGATRLIRITPENGKGGTLISITQD